MHVGRLKEMYLGTKHIYSTEASRALESKIQEDRENEGHCVDQATLARTIRYAFSNILDNLGVKVLSYRCDMAYKTGKVHGSYQPVHGLNWKNLPVATDLPSADISRINSLTDMLGAAVSLMSTYGARLKSNKGKPRNTGEGIVDFVPTAEVSGDSILYHQDGGLVVARLLHSYTRGCAEAMDERRGSNTKASLVQLKLIAANLLAQFGQGISEGAFSEIEATLEALSGHLGALSTSYWSIPKLTKRTRLPIKDHKWFIIKEIKAGNLRTS